MTHIRKVTPADMSAILALVRELADYEKGLHNVITTPESYLKDFNDKVFKTYLRTSSC